MEPERMSLKKKALLLSWRRCFLKKGKPHKGPPSIPTIQQLRFKGDQLLRSTRCKSDTSIFKSEAISEGGGTEEESKVFRGLVANTRGRRTSLHSALGKRGKKGREIAGSKDPWEGVMSGLRETPSRFRSFGAHLLYYLAVVCQGLISGLNER